MLNRNWIERNGDDTEKVDLREPARPARAGSSSDQR
jgi:hypothetical protein